MSEFADLPHFIKYMGSKREILETIHTVVDELDIDSDWLCDLFAGTSIVAASFKDKYNIQSNDIQRYSSVFAETYFSNLQTVPENRLEEIRNDVEMLINEFDERHPELNFDYSQIDSHQKFKEIEDIQRNFIGRDFEIENSLFTKCYSGTYWSSNQCKWIDSIRTVADNYINLPEYHAILSSLMFALSYASQSTGHFAQYRDVTESNLNDILLYRNKDIWGLFSKKFIECTQLLSTPNQFDNRITTQDYELCLGNIPENTIVYADPPYTNVHYSRFYHALETLVRYDNPVVEFKGRYRNDRHQSPFDIKTRVKKAFKILFEGVKERNSHLVLSYSDNGMISLDDIRVIGESVFGNDYLNEVHTKEYTHMKMGRSDEYQMDVNELLITYKKV